ncbi:tetratricopeptide repeat-containing diguanylate cyclase [Rubrivivax gelatinosus]|uniref:tetratricopeptide repeat-containing diguanylate cyclase n=1 Tax=Rubrivivax gelatinosus TaxID=28068 RepID=UPI0031F8BB9B
MNTLSGPDAPTADAAADEAAAAEGERLLDQAETHYYTRPGEALRLAEQALAGGALGMRGLARARRVRGVALAFCGRHADALAELEAALELVAEDDLLPRCKALRALAIAAEEAGALDTALDWGVRAAEVARALGDPVQLGNTLLSIAVVRSRSGEPEAGLQQYHEVLALYEQAGEQAGCANVLNNMGINCKNLGRHAQALEYLDRAIAIGETEAAAAGACIIAALNRVEPLVALGRRDEALATLRQAIERTVGTGYRSAECHGHVLLGELLAAAGDDAAALAALERAVDLATRLGGRNHVARAHKALWALHKAAGRFEAALVHHEAFHEAERSQFNAESDRKLRSLQVRFDLARAQHDAAMARMESARLTAQTRTDALTGVANRRHLEERLRDEYARALRNGHPLAVAMIDIDDFKRINDRYGHATGDVVLREVASLLRRHCRDIDLVARYGGEEFCIVFVEAAADDALRVCEAMRAAVEAHGWPAIAPGLQVTLSLGLAERDGADGRQALVAAADARLYEAKRHGKNRVVPEVRPAA